MGVQPSQRDIQGLLHVRRLASVFVGALVRDWMPSDCVVATIEPNIAFSVAGHNVAINRSLYNVL